MLKRKLIYLKREDIESLNIDLFDIIDVIEKMFYEKGLGKVEMPPKPGVHTKKNAFIHAMPAYIPAFNAVGIKWVSGFPENYKKGLPYITGLFILNDPETGIPISIMDCTWITAWRTAAATAVAAKFLASRNAETVSILGCGVQGETNLRMLSKAFKIKYAKVYDIDKNKAETYSKSLGKELDIDIQSQRDPKTAVENSDIIITAGPFLEKPNPIIEFSWIKKGAFCCPLDLDSYFKPEVFEKSDLLFTDDKAQFNSFKERGYFKNVTKDVFDLGDLICKKIKGRENEKQIITSINIGIALEDVALASLIYEKARKLNIGTTLDL